MDWERRQDLREMGYNPDDLSVQLDLAWIRYLLWQQVQDGADPRILGRPHGSRLGHPVPKSPPPHQQR